MLVMSHTRSTHRTVPYTVWCQYERQIRNAALPDENIQTIKEKIALMSPRRPVLGAAAIMISIKEKIIRSISSQSLQKLFSAALYKDPS